MSDDIFPGLRTGPNDHETREQAESQDKASLENELREQDRLGNAQIDPFAANRVATSGKGRGK